MNICKHCGKPITGEYRKGINFVYHLLCYIKLTERLRTEIKEENHDR